MSYLVQKFGGSSMATPEKIQRAARRAIAAKEAGHSVVVVVSAMAKETDRLLALGHGFGDLPDARELDVALSTGEMLSASLMAIALQAEGAPARSLLGFQLPILTDSIGGAARILSVDVAKLLACFVRGEIPVVAGFQGVDAHGRLTTLGRGGSDTTAVAIAGALGGAHCEIYTDVDGIYSADPRICEDAVLLRSVSYPFMIEAAGLGANVMHDRSVMLGLRYQVPITVKSSLVESNGTIIGNIETAANCVTLDGNIARISLIDEDPDEPLSHALGELAVPYIMLGRVSPRETMAVIPQSSLNVLSARFRKHLCFVDRTLAKVSVVGAVAANAGHCIPALVARLSHQGIRCRGVAMGNRSVSFLVEASEAKEAARHLHSYCAPTLKEAC